LSQQEVEHVNFPGIASTMLGLPKYSNDFNRAMGPNTMWFKDGNTGAADINIALATYNAGFTARHSHLFKTPTYDNKSRFRVAVTLSDIFLFCEDF
jgi:hypothetical protein